VAILCAWGKQPLEGPDEGSHVLATVLQPGAQTLFQIAGRRVERAVEGLGILLQNIAILCGDSLRDIDHIEACLRHEGQCDFPRGHSASSRLMGRRYPVRPRVRR